MGHAPSTSKGATIMHLRLPQRNLLESCREAREQYCMYAMAPTQVVESLEPPSQEGPVHPV